MGNVNCALQDSTHLANTFKEAKNYLVPLTETDVNDLWAPAQAKDRIDVSFPFLLNSIKPLNTYSSITVCASLDLSLWQLTGCGPVRCQSRFCWRHRRFDAREVAMGSNCPSLVPMFKTRYIAFSCSGSSMECQYSDTVWPARAYRVLIDNPRLTFKMKTLQHSSMEQ